MFEIVNDDGAFIRPNRKSHIGIVDLEIINDTYFNIDSKDYIFATGETCFLKIASKSDDSISRSKRLRIETSSFYHPDKARDVISRYLDSIRIILLKRGFSYRTPLVVKVEEELDSRRCVGAVEIKLKNGERLNINENERFHNENGSWYRLYSTNNIPIRESDVLCIESSAYEESDVARQAIDVICSRFEIFLKSNSIGFCLPHKKTVPIYMSANFCMSMEASATLAKLVPFDGDLLKSTYGDVHLQSVLALLEHKGLQDLPNLYNILELIENDMGNQTQSENRNEIEAKGLSTKDEIEKFTYTVNRVDVIGLEHVRHGVKFKGNPNPEKALTVEGCKSIMKGLIDKWLDFKINHGEKSP